MNDNSEANKRKAEFLEDFYEMLSKEIIIAYRGTFEKSVLGVLAKNIESTIDTSSVLRRKFFKLFLELSQNISDHSVEILNTSAGETSGSGLLILKYEGENYLFITGNLINNEDLKSVSESVERINSLNRDQLRELKREQIELVETGKKNCLGLIQIALISGHNLEIKAIEAENNKTFLIFSAVISKEV
ncbi:MAG: SiaB family protein kinase [Bacteroidota bacterium]